MDIDKNGAKEINADDGDVQDKWQVEKKHDRNAANYIKWDMTSTAKGKR